MKHVLILLVASAALSGIAAVAASEGNRPALPVESPPVASPPIPAAAD